MKRVRKFLANRQKPLAIHIEALHLSQVESVLHKYLNILSFKPQLYCLTPVNQMYVEGFFGPVENNYDELLALAYQKLVKKGYKLQLHIHLTRVPNQFSMEVKCDMIEMAYDWLTAISGAPTELVLGWYAEEEGVKKLASILNMRVLGMQEFLRTYRVLHDYNLVGAK